MTAYNRNHLCGSCKALYDIFTYVNMLHISGRLRIIHKLKKLSQKCHTSELVAHTILFFGKVTTEGMTYPNRCFRQSKLTDIQAFMLIHCYRLSWF